MNAIINKLFNLLTVGFHNFNLRIFNSRVSDPNKLIADVFSTRYRISMCQGLGPKKHDEISEIDRIHLFISIYITITINIFIGIYIENAMVIFST